MDGVYDDDPETTPGAKCFDRLTYSEALKRNLKVMDLTAISLAMGQELPIIVFNLRKKDNIKNIISGDRIGTLITGEGS